MLGKRMVQFPLDPQLSKMLLTSVTLGCSEEVLTVVAMLSVPEIFYRPRGREEESDTARERFYVPESDHLTLLNVFNQWRRHNFSKAWCKEHFLHTKSLIKAREVRAQLADIMVAQKIKVSSSGGKWDSVRKAICSAYFFNSAKIRSIGSYINLLNGLPTNLHPSSSLCSLGNVPEFVVYHEVVLTSKEYMRTVTAVDAEWLAELGPMFFAIRRSHAEHIQEMERTRQHQAALDRKFQDAAAKSLERASLRRGGGGGGGVALASSTAMPEPRQNAVTFGMTRRKRKRRGRVGHSFQ